MKFKRVIAEILAAVLCINTLSISTLAENEAQTFIEVMEQEHIEPVMDQWGQNDSRAENSPEGVLGDANIAETATGSVVNQWGENAEILRPEEIVAAEAEEGEVAEAGALEGTEAGILGEGDITTKDALIDALTTAASTTQAGATTEIKLGADIDLGTLTSAVQITCAAGNAAAIILDLKGYKLKGTSAGELFNIHKGTFIIRDCGVEPNGKILNEGYGNILNVSSDGPVIKLESGYLSSKGSVVKVYGGSLAVGENQYPYLISETAEAVQYVSGTLELRGGFYSTKPSKVVEGYNAYYIKTMHYYVVMQAKPLWLKAPLGEGTPDEGYLSLDAVTARIEDLYGGTQSITEFTVFLVDEYSVPSAESITLPAGTGTSSMLSITLDLYGSELKNMPTMIIPEYTKLEITDSLLGGLISVPSQIAVQKTDGTLAAATRDNLELTGGSYKNAHSRAILESFIDPDKYMLVETDEEGDFEVTSEATEPEEAAVPEGTASKIIYTVVPNTAKILVKGKGSAPAFEDTVIKEEGKPDVVIPGAFTIAEPGDTLVLLSDYSVTRVNESGTTEPYELQIEKPVTIDLNGHTLSSSYSTVAYVSSSGSGASIINTSSEKAYIYGNAGVGGTSYAVYVQNDRKDGFTIDFEIQNVTLRAQNQGGMASSTCLQAEGICDVNAINCVFEKITYAGAMDNNSGSVITVSTGGKVNVCGDNTVFSGSDTTKYYGKTLEIGSSAELVIDCSTSNKQLENLTDLSGVNDKLYVMGNGTLTINDGYFPCTMEINEYMTPNAINIYGGLFGPRVAKTSFFGDGFEKDTIASKVYIYGGNYDADSAPIHYMAAGCYQVEETVGGYSYSIYIGAAIASHNVGFGKGLYLRIGIQTNPRLEQRVSMNDIAIKLTWAAQSQRGTAQDSVEYFITAADEHTTTTVDGRTVTTYYKEIEFSPQNMTDEIVIEAECRNPDEHVQYQRRNIWGIMIPDQVDTTIRDYTQFCYELPEKTQKLTDAMATMLMYGSEAQKYNGYRTTDPELADNVAWLTYDMKQNYKDQYPTPPSPGLEILPAKTETVTPLFKAHSLTLGGNYLIRLFFDDPRTSNLQKEGETEKTYRIKYTHGSTNEYIYPDPKVEGGPSWHYVDKEKDPKLMYVEFPGILYTNCTVKQKALMEVSEDGGNTWTSTGETATSGVNRYLYDYVTYPEKFNQSKYSAEFAKAAYRFGVYAREYVRK